MKYRRSLIAVGIIGCLLCLSYFNHFRQNRQKMFGAPPYGEPESSVPETLDPWAWLQEWQRPDGPPIVALQIGHLDNAELPEELSKLIGNTGAYAAGVTEIEVNTQIAELTAELLEAQGVVVEILPATVPPDYWADVFMAIHADGSLDTSVNGFKIAAPWRDFTGNAHKLVTLLENEYTQATLMQQDLNISRNMRGYYAFSWWRYDHAIHPMTTAVIVETGFLTNASDRKIIVDQPEISARALANGVLKYLETEGLLS